MDENDNYHKENQILVYIPYQVLMDINLTTEKAFDFDLWVGYKESFIENRREVKEGAAYISRKGGTEFLCFGRCWSRFSVKEAANPAFFAGQYPFGLRDILIKIFYESDFNLYNESLWGNRTVLKNNNYEQRAYGLAFLFKL